MGGKRGVPVLLLMFFVSFKIFCGVLISREITALECSLWTKWLNPIHHGSGVFLFVFMFLLLSSSLLSLEKVFKILKTY